MISEKQINDAVNSAVIEAVKRAVSLNTDKIYSSVSNYFGSTWIDGKYTSRFDNALQNEVEVIFRNSVYSFLEKTDFKKYVYKISKYLKT